MRIVLARRRNGASLLVGPPEVHAYRVPDDADPSGQHVLNASTSPSADAASARVDGEPVVWLSPCGDWIKPGEAEIVESFLGAPCPKCLMFATLASTAPPVTRVELEGSPQERRALEGATKGCEEFAATPASAVIEVTTSSTSGFAASWRERVAHRVDPHAPHAELDGGTLVMGLCGGLGWGPLEIKPEQWPVCPDCEAIASEGNS